MAETLRLSPVISTYLDDNYENLQIEVILPGVEKKDISFKLDSSSDCEKFRMAEIAN